MPQRGVARGEIELDTNCIQHFQIRKNGDSILISSRVEIDLTLPQKPPFGVVRVQSDGLAYHFDTFCGPSGAAEARAEVVDDIRVVWIEFQCSLKVRDGPIVLS